MTSSYKVLASIATLAVLGIFALYHGSSSQAIASDSNRFLQQSPALSNQSTGNWTGSSAPQNSSGEGNQSGNGNYT